MKVCEVRAVDHVVVSIRLCFLARYASSLAFQVLPDKIILATRGPNIALDVVRKVVPLPSVSIEPYGGYSRGRSTEPNREAPRPAEEYPRNPGGAGAVRWIARWNSKNRLATASRTTRPAGGRTPCNRHYRHGPAWLPRDGGDGRDSEVETIGALFHYARIRQPQGASDWLNVAPFVDSGWSRAHVR